MFNLTAVLETSLVSLGDCTDMYKVVDSFRKDGLIFQLLQDVNDNRFELVTVVYKGKVMIPTDEQVMDNLVTEFKAESIRLEQNRFNKVLVATDIFRKHFMGKTKFLFNYFKGHSKDFVDIVMFNKGKQYLLKLDVESTFRTNSPVYGYYDCDVIIKTGKNGDYSDLSYIKSYKPTELKRSCVDILLNRILNNKHFKAFNGDFNDRLDFETVDGRDYSVLSINGIQIEAYTYRKQIDVQFETLDEHISNEVAQQVFENEDLIDTPEDIAQWYLFNYDEYDMTENFSIISYTEEKDDINHLTVDFYNSLGYDVYDIQSFDKIKKSSDDFDYIDSKPDIYSIGDRYFTVFNVFNRDLKLYLDSYLDQRSSKFDIKVNFLGNDSFRFFDEHIKAKKLTYDAPDFSIDQVSSIDFFRYHSMLTNVFFAIDDPVCSLNKPENSKEKSLSKFEKYDLVNVPEVGEIELSRTSLYKMFIDKKREVAINEYKKLKEKSMSAKA